MRRSRSRKEMSWGGELGNALRSWPWCAHQVPTENPRDIRGCGVVMSSMQAAVEGTLDLVEATQISCGFCGGNLEYVDDYRERRTGGLWKGSNCSWDQAEEWRAMGGEVALANEEVVE